MPTQVFVSATPAVQEFLRTCRAEGATKLVDQEAVDMDELYRLIDEHARLGGAPAKIHELMEGSEVVRRKETASEEPLTELERMRLESQERSYQRMVQGVAPLATAKRRQEQSVHNQGIQWATNFGTQVIVAFIGAFLLGYFFVETFVSPDNQVMKVLAGAGCSFATLLLETCLLMVHESKEQMIAKREEERQAREKKKRAAAAAARQAGASSSPAASPADQSEATAAAASAADGGAAAEASGEGASAEEESKPKPASEKKTD